MHKTHARRQKNIKTKLMAAICMLLVSSIMMVSTTYAWFTLSTAPEVTGINTAVGANGNLEMALLPKDGLLTSIKSEAGDSVKAIQERNITWGNLVDVSDNSIYGLDKITLYPAELNLNAEGKVPTDAAVLKTPSYGADGRVAQLLPNTLTSYYEGAEKGFAPNEYYGVRAIGTASGMTPRQLSYRNARSAANTARAQAANLSAQSLNRNGSALAGIAVKYATDKDAAVFDKTHVAVLRTIVNDLVSTGAVMDQLETAYMQYILALSASQTYGSDAIWTNVEAAVNAEGATLDTVVAAIGEGNLSVMMPGINAYKASLTKVTSAEALIADMEAEVAADDAATFTWAEIKAAMMELANPEEMMINDFKAMEAMSHIEELMAAVTSNNVKVYLKSGAGVYADIADQSGDYTADVAIEGLEYNGIKVPAVNAKMVADSTLPANYLPTIGSAVELAGAPASGTGETMPLSDMYGYILDLAFRTNAAESELRLTQEALDRIYGDNTNEETMGHGATMTFASPSLNTDQVKGLMNSIKLVFFNPADGSIYCYGGLDTSKATVGVDGTTAPIFAYTLSEGGTFTEYVEATYVVETPASGDTPATYRLATGDETATHAKVGEEYKLADFKAGATEGTWEEATSGATHYKHTYTVAAGKNPVAENKILTLTQNTAHAVSVLVYLDGTTVTNGDVAATSEVSLTGTMNLQFCSSATLVPMEYTPLHIPGAAETPDTPAGGGEAGGEGGGT